MSQVSSGPKSLGNTHYLQGNGPLGDHNRGDYYKIIVEPDGQFSIQDGTGTTVKQMGKCDRHGSSASKLFSEN